MLRCAVHGAQDLRLAEEATPRPGPGEVLLRLGAAGICGSDIHYFLHGRVGSFEIREPLTPGHEASAVVVETGAGVTRLRAGTNVAIDPSHPCGRCRACRSGRENLCENMRFLGSASVFPHVQGLFREYFVLPERQCVAVDAHVPLGELAMAEPLSVALHSARRAGELLGARVLVTGSGTIGCMMTIAARLAGAAHVTVTDIVDHPLEVARRVGADATVRTDRLPADARLAEQTGEFDAAFEVSGAAGAFGTCLDSLRRGGTLVQVGTLPPEGMHVFANRIMQRELDVRGSFRFANVFGLAVDSIAERRVDVRPAVSAQFPLAQAEAAIRAATDKSANIKVQLVAA